MRSESPILMGLFFCADYDFKMKKTLLKSLMKKAKKISNVKKKHLTDFVELYII